MDVNANLQWLDDICCIYAKGKELYEAIAKSLQASPGTELIVSPANLGDTVFIATLSKAYKKAHGIKNLLIAAKERQAEAAEWFEGVDGTLPLDETEMMCLRYYFTISRNFYSNGIRYGHIPCYIDSEHPDVFFHIPPGFSGIPLFDVWTKRILDIPDNPEICNLVVPKGVKRDNAEKFKNAVLIAPAAFTNKGIPETFWEKLVNVIKDEGIEVYCNSGGLDYDRIIGGTTEFLASTRDLIINAPLFKHVVAVRSGFTDLVAKTEARMSVLHLGGNGATSLRVEYGSRLDDVRDLGRMENIFPILYDANREDEIIRLILEDII